MIRYFQKIWLWILRWLGFRGNEESVAVEPPNPIEEPIVPIGEDEILQFRTEFVDDLPDTLAPMRVYVVGENGFQWVICMVCPCGCEAVIQLNLLETARPCWQYRQHHDGSTSISPSIWRKSGCHSHFFIREGRVHWAVDFNTEGMA